MTPVEELVRAQIRAEGPLSFSTVMKMALYHPDHGYYTNLRGFGAEGDFITSPERHPAFGWLLGRQALDVWEAVGRPQPFRILELGGGSGALAQPLVAFLRQHIQHLTYTLDEPGPSLREIQQGKLHDPAFCWQGAGEPHHFVIANEVADALPVHRAVIRGGRPHELLVALEPETDALVFAEAPAPHAGLAAYLDELHYVPPDRTLLDICLELPAFVDRLAGAIDNPGVGLVLDYAASPPRDSLLTYYRHTLGSDPLVRLGQQDISAHVDLRTLVRLAVGRGLRAGATAQRGLLANLGFQQVVAELRGSTDRDALGALVAADGLGGQIACVFLVRGLPAYRPVGAVGGRAWPTPAAVPGLAPDPAEQDFLGQWRDAFGGDDDERPNVAGRSTR